VLRLASRLRIDAIGDSNKWHHNLDYTILMQKGYINHKLEEFKPLEEAS
jgi:hypothetical protein